MNQMISSMINFLMCALEIYMLNIFLSAIFLKRVSRKQWSACFIMAVCIHFIINLQGIQSLNFVGVSGLLFAFSMLVFKITVRKAFIYTSIYYIVFACGREMAFEMLYRLLTGAFPWMERIFSFANGAIFYVVEYLLSFLFLLFLRKYMIKIEIGEDSSFDWYLLVMPVSSILILLSFVYMDFPNEKYLQILMCCGAFLFYVSNAVVFIILAHFTQVMTRVKIAELSLLKKDMEKENFENVVKLNDVYRKCMHDIHRCFYQLKSLALSGDNEAMVGIIDGWEDNLKKESSNKLYTGSPVVNSLLSGCYGHAKERGIEIDIFVEDGLNLDSIQEVDKISMFGNLLDNAVEAATECEEGDRKINIKMYMGNRNMLVFLIENTWTKNLHSDGEKLLSTKEDSGNHGLGFGISRELAQKYGGTLEWEEQGEWFVTTLMVSTERRF